MEKPAGDQGRLPKGSDFEKHRRCLIPWHLTPLFQNRNTLVISDPYKDHDLCFWFLFQVPCVFLNFCPWMSFVDFSTVSSVAHGSLCEGPSKTFLAVVFMCLGCSNEMSSMAWLKQQTFTSHSCGVLLGPHVAERERESKRDHERALISSSVHEDTNPIMRPSPSWPHTFQRPHFQIVSFWGLGLQHMNGGPQFSP